MEKFKFRKNIDIGNLEAEHDKWLSFVFVKKPELKIVLDVDNAKGVIVGRTGSGKSALIKYIEDRETNVTRINPEEMSLKYLSNSDILDYFRKLGVKLDIFYKLLWKHVFVVEFLKLYFGENYIKERNIIQYLKDNYLSNKKRKKAIEYLQTWEREFWENTEYRVKSIESKLKKEFVRELGTDASFYDFFVKYKQFSGEQKEENKLIEVLNKAQNVVNSIHLEEIYDVIKILKEDILFKSQKRLYIVIDDLDKDWAESNITLELIKALLITVNDLRDLNNTKIIIALRDNLFELIFKNPQRGIQREKFLNVVTRIEWTKEELREMLTKRLTILMKGSYTSQSPTIEDVLPEAKKNKPSGFDYMLERSFMRPRDIIDFFNKCIEKADGAAKITREILNLAETEYSMNRFNAVNDEWWDNFGDMKLLTCFLKGTQNGFEIKEINENNLINFISHGNTSNLSIYTLSLRDKYINNQITFENLLKEIICILYRTGIVGIKNSPEEKMIYSFQSRRIFDPIDLTGSSKVYIHPAFSNYLKIDRILATV